MRLGEDLVLRTAGRYPRPGNPGDTLPLVLGDFLTGEPSTHGGATPAVLINRDDGIWLVNDAPSEITVPRLYLEETVQELSTYTYNPAAVLTDIDGQAHTVATIQINPSIAGAALGKRLSVDMRGAVDAAGQLISNPITALQYAFTTHGTWQAAEFDPFTCNKARELAQALGYPIHWAMVDTRSYKQHLSDVLYHYHGNHTLNLNGQLVITLDQEGFVPTDQILAHYDAQIHIAGEDPEDAIEYDVDKRNLANSLHCSYAYSWVSDTYGQTADRTHPVSIRSHGVQHRDIRLPGIRLESHLNQWTNLFLSRYAMRPAIVRFSLPTLLYLAQQPTTYATLTWVGGPSTQGRGWTERVLKVLNAGFDFERHEQALECFDTGLTFRRPTYLALEDQGGTLRYLYVLEDGRPQLVQYVPGEVSLLEDVVWWISRQAPGGTTFYVYPDANGRLVISNVQPTGTGVGLPLGFVDRRWNVWDLRVIDEAGRYQFRRR